MSKTHDPEQVHPDGITGKDVIPDTHDHTDIPETVRGPAHGETHYVPGDGFLISNGGFSKKSKATIYTEKVKAIRAARGDKRTKFSLPQDGTFISEDEVLAYAAAIKAHRKMTGAKSVKEKMFAEARARRHEGTDAEDSSKDGHHSQSDSFDIDKSRSTVRIGMGTCGPPGMELNGSKVYHHMVVTLDITNPDGRQLCSVMMSPEQFAVALVGMSHVPCTLSRYWSITDDAVHLAERVRPPESVRKRMAKRLRHRLKEQTDALLAVAREMSEQAETGKPARKTQLRDLAERVARAVEHSAANAAFTVDQAREEVTGIMESAAIQFLGQQNIDAETLWAAAGPALGMDDDVPRLADGGGES